MEREKTVTTVIGHKAPDSDSVCSAIAYAGLLKILGINAQAVTASKINRESRFILDGLDLDEPPVITESANRVFVLVDHSSYSLAHEGVNETNVIEVIDHHDPGDVITNDGSIKNTIEKVGACSTLIYEKYKENDVPLDYTNAALLLSGILSDTSFMKRNVTEKDQRAYEELLKLVTIEDVDAYYDQMEEERLSYEGMSDFEIFMYDYKEYEIGSYSYGLASLAVRKKEGMEELIYRMKDVMEHYRDQLKKDYLFVKIGVLENGNSHMIADSEEGKKLLIKALELTDKGEYLFTDKELSRKKIIVPAINKYLNTK